MKLYIRKGTGPWHPGSKEEYAMGRDDNGDWYTVYLKQHAKQKWGPKPSWDNAVTNGVWELFESPEKAEPVVPPLELNIKAKAKIPVDTFYKPGIKFKKAGCEIYTLMLCQVAVNQARLIIVESATEPSLVGSAWSFTAIPMEAYKGLKMGVNKDILHGLVNGLTEVV